MPRNLLRSVREGLDEGSVSFWGEQVLNVATLLPGHVRPDTQVRFVA